MSIYDIDPDMGLSRHSPEAKADQAALGDPGPPPAPAGPAAYCGACARSGVGACDDFPDCPGGNGAQAPATGKAVQYQTLAELKAAYDECVIHDAVLTLDNDDAFVYAGPESRRVRVFGMAPDELLQQALDLLDIPWEHV